MFENLAPADELPTGDAADRRLVELAAEGAALSSQISQLQARLVEVTAEIESLQGRLLGMTAKAWSTWRFGLTPREGGQLSRLGQRLQKLPAIANAFAEGRLSAGVVTSLTNVATPENEDVVLATTEVASGAQLQTLVRSFRRVRRAETHTGEPYYRSSVDELGWWNLRARLDAVDGARFDAAVRAAMEVDAEVEPDPVPDATERDPFDRRGDERRRSTQVDGLVRLADAYLSGAAADGPVPDRFQTVVVIDTDDEEPVADAGASEPEAADGAAAHDRTPSGGRVVGAGHVDRTVLDEMLCESTVAYVLRRDGRPVTVTSPTRFATKDQMRALLVRDRWCTFPGCGREHHLIAHHVKHYDPLEGPTRLDNLLLLCRGHHRLIHRRRWTIELRDDGLTKIFTRPDGTVLPSARRFDPTVVDDAREVPAPGPRHTGCGDHLTEYGQDVILHEWLEPGADGSSADDSS